MNMGILTYLSLDAMTEGVGASQVKQYLFELANNSEFKIHLISFEKTSPPNSLISDFEKVGIQWTRLNYGSYGLLGSLKRALQLWIRVPTKGLIHARSDFCAFVAICKFNRKVIWDCRALMADHRKSLKDSGLIDINYWIFRFLEFVCAKASSEIIIITNAVKPILMRRYNLKAEKFTVISTCTNLLKFNYETPRNNKSDLRVLIAGTLSPAYDYYLMNLIIYELRKRTKVIVTLALGKGYSINAISNISYDSVITVSHDEMPRLIASHDLGIALWRTNFGDALASVAATKVGEFLATGRPVVVNYNQGDIGKLIGKHGAGVVTYGNSNDEVLTYAEQILRIVHNDAVSHNCRKLAETEFNLYDGVNKLAQVYKKILH